MPRNVRSKAAPRATTKRRRDSNSSSSLDLSSDGGYSALEEVSDSDDDDDEDGVAAAEEKHIIKDVAKSRRARSPRPSVQTEEDDADEEDEDEDSEDDDDDDDDGEELDELDEADFAIEESLDEDESEETVHFADDGASWNGISESDANHNGAGFESQSSPVKRQVRFAGVPDSDSDSTASDVSAFASEFFPDIFVEQNSLDPSFRREIEHESDSSVSSSFWDYASGFAQNSVAAALPYSDDDLLAAGFSDPLLDPSAPDGEAANGEQDLGNEEGSGGDNVDGYETDGDTTEDDEPEPLPIRRKHSRRVQSVDSDDETTDSESDVDVPVRHRRGHPRARRFAVTLKGKRPVAVIHPVSGKMVIFTPEKPREIDIMSGLFPDPGLDLFPPQMPTLQSSALMGHTTSVMMGAMFSTHTFGDYIHSQHVGPVEAFFPNLSSDTFAGDDSEFSGDFDEDDGESILRIEDFIQFDRNAADEPDPVDALFDMNDILGQSENDTLVALGDSTEVEEQSQIEQTDQVEQAVQQDTDASTPMGTPMATPSVAPSSRRASFAASSSLGAAADDDEDNGNDSSSAALPPLLAHFSKNRDAVGAFRRNQINQQLILGGKATADSLALSGPYMMGTLRGIKNGSLEAVAAPLTPPRRHKRASVSFTGSPLDPSAQKRKASGGLADSAMNHKRQRSISEVKDLMLG